MKLQVAVNLSGSENTILLLPGHQYLTRGSVKNAVRLKEVMFCFYKNETGCPFGTY